MNKISNFILRSCGYTVLLMLVLYAFLAVIGGTDQGVPILRFLLVLLYGVLISGAELLYRSLPLRKALRIPIHYGMLLAGFVIVYIFSGVASGVNASRVFIAIALFTALYAAVGGIAAGLGALVDKADKRIDSMPKKEKPPRPEYKSRFGEEND